VKVVLFSPYPDRLQFQEDDEVICPDREMEISDADFLVSFGHRGIFNDNLISRFPKRIINIHIGLLPWNRGADPNFWSWFDNTRKGVTIHYVDPGIDTGDIIFQVEIEKFKNNPMTLASTYDELMDSAVKALKWSWPSIKRERCFSIEQPPIGSSHKKKDKEPWMAQLPLGWNTPVKTVEELGRKHRGE
jgi:methionyl-tRNA formyltransferase